MSEAEEAPTGGIVAKDNVPLSTKEETPVVPSTQAAATEEENKTDDVKRVRDGSEAGVPADTKRPKVEGEEKPEPAPVPASKEGLSFFNDNDVLSGRGGGTNVHPGNRNFRDLINLHRRSYLKARKNDKPSISRQIVRAVREANGRFLRKDDVTGLWFEIGDDAAREKTSQALRQRAPEMRKLLFDTERDEARAVAEEHMRQQRMMMGLDASGSNGANPPPAMQMPPGMASPAMFPPGMNPAMAFFMANPKPGTVPPGMEAYQQMFQAMAQQGRFVPPPLQQQQQHQVTNNGTTMEGAPAAMPPVTAAGAPPGPSGADANEDEATAPPAATPTESNGQ